MPSLLVSHAICAAHDARSVEAAARGAKPVELIAPPADPAARLPDADCAR